MNKPVYEIPIGDGESRIPPARDSDGPTLNPLFGVPPAAPAAFSFDSQFPSDAPPPAGAPSYLNAPPPTVTPPSRQTTEEALAALYNSAPAPGAAAYDFPPSSAATPTFAAVESTMPTYEHPTYTPPEPAAPTERAPFDLGSYAAPSLPPAYPPTTYEPAAFTAPAPAPAHRLEPAPEAPVVSEVAISSEPLRLSDRVPEVGEGQAGSDVDLVAALNQVVLLRASDLHVTVNAVPMVRVDGGLRPIPDFPSWDAEKVSAALFSILSDRQREEFEADLELDFAYTLSETSRFRVNLYQQRNVIGAAFRLIPTQIKQLAALGVPENVGNFAQLPRGLVLVTGPTGSGKSTTLAALIDLVNSTRADHIVTVEDPIEFMHENKKSLVNQREVGHDTHSFQNALKHVLRQDPDVILIGELRDLETISVALTAAETGHLVFATLHTQDAPQTIDRVIDVFPPHQQGQVRAQLAATLQGVVCQTLIKKVGGGRAVATEVLITTPAVANLIREGKTYQVHSSMQAGRDLGMHTMDQHLADLVNAGQVRLDVALEKAHDVEVLKGLVTRASTANDPFASGMSGLRS